MKIKKWPQVLYLYYVRHLYRLPITAVRSTVISIYNSAADCSHETTHCNPLNMKMRWNTALCQEKNIFSFINRFAFYSFITLNLELRRA